jgi:predicted phosphodiesterase
VRYGLLSDVHGNLLALTTAVRRLTSVGVDRWLCAGDLIDYGPQPNECIAELVALDPVCVAGNHELVALGELPESRFSRRARESVRWTRAQLTEDSRRYLAALPRTATVPGLVMAHGSLSDPEEYIRDDGQAQEQLDRLAAAEPAARVLVLGHTHRAALFRSGFGALPASPGTSAPLSPGNRYLVNPGAVGQSREREPNPLVRFALIELDGDGAGAGSVRFYAEDYDHGAVRDALRAQRLPVDAMHIRPGRVATVQRRVRTLARGLRPS